jgi:hypothetical protein
MKLPDEHLMNDIKELELITRYLDATLQPLFDDLDNDILFVGMCFFSYASVYSILLIFFSTSVYRSNTINTPAKTPTAMNISKRRP